MVKTVYLAGKITGYANYKKEFDAAQMYLEIQGYTVLSPAILPSEGFTYDAYIRMSAAMLKECDAICLLPNWKDSEGAKREYEYACRMGKCIYELENYGSKNSVFGCKLVTRQNNGGCD